RSPGKGSRPKNRCRRKPTWQWNRLCGRCCGDLFPTIGLQPDYPPHRLALMATFETSNTESLSVDELRERLAGLTRLLDVTRTLAEEIDLDKLLDTLTREACIALDCERASLF